MADSVIEKTQHISYEDITMTTSSSLHDGFYYTDHYFSGNKTIISATIIMVSSNMWAQAEVQNNGASMRLFAKAANRTAKVRVSYLE